MLALTPNRGWNYQATNTAAGNVTASVYVNPTPVNGQTVVAGSIVQGLVPTVLTSHANAESNLFGGLAFTHGAGGYNVTAEVSFGSTAQVPGAPLFIATTLTQGDTSTPYAGVTEQVLSVGTVAGASACQTPANGAQVRYTFQGQSYTISYVPGCGMTQIVLPSGATYTLVSVGTYNVGDLDRTRKVGTLSLVDTARSLLGLERNDFPAAHLFK